MIVLALCGLLLAQTGQDSLEEGMRLFSELQYEKAKPHLAAAKMDESLEPAQRAKAALHLAVVQLSFGDVESAKRNIRDGLRLDPTLELPVGASPAFADLVSEARAELPQAAAPEPAPTSVVLWQSTAWLGESSGQILIEAAPEALERIAKVTVSYRSPSESDWQQIEAARSEKGFAASLPLALGAAGCQLFVEAQDATGATIGRLGSESSPILYEHVAPVAPAPAAAIPPPTVTEEPEEDEPFYTTWWFWTVVGTAVVGGTIAAIVVATSDGKNNKNGNNGSGDCHESGSGKGCLVVTVE